MTRIEKLLVNVKLGKVVFASFNDTEEIKKHYPKNFLNIRNTKFGCYIKL